MRRDLLDGIAHVHDDEIAGFNALVLEEEQAHLALDAPGGTPGDEAFTREDLHGNSQAHSRPQR